MAVIPCVCPPKADGEPRHPNGDTVKLRPKLDFRSALAARNVIILAKQEDENIGAGELLAMLTETYLLLGVESWTLTDGKGKAVPVSRSAIRDLMAEHSDAAMTVGDEADGLYSEAVITPLVARASTYSPPTPINGSTSAMSGRSPVPRKPSKRSLTTTTPTDVIETMSASPGGGYSS